MTPTRYTYKTSTQRGWKHWRLLPFGSIRASLPTQQSFKSNDNTVAFGRFMFVWNWVPKTARTLNPLNEIAFIQFSIIFWNGLIQCNSIFLASYLTYSFYMKTSMAIIESEMLSKFFFQNKTWSLKEFLNLHFDMWGGHDAMDSLRLHVCSSFLSFRDASMVRLKEPCNWW